VIKTRSPKPALLGVLLEAEPDGFACKATDLEIWLSQTTQIVQVERAGVALVDAARLLSVVKEMPDDAVQLETDDNLQLHVRGARAKFKLLAMKPADFPPFVAPDEATPFSVKATDLRRLVSQTAFAASRENSDYARAAVLFKVGGGRLELVATDARRLAKASCAVESTAEASAMIPNGTAKMLMPMLSEPDDGEMVAVSLGDCQARFEVNGTTLPPPASAYSLTLSPRRVSRGRPADPSRLAGHGQVRADRRRSLASAPGRRRPLRSVGSGAHPIARRRLPLRHGAAEAAAPDEPL
jgi:DNA polymerase-3 subunit beta